MMWDSAFGPVVAFGLGGVLTEARASWLGWGPLESERAT